MNSRSDLKEQFPWARLHHLAYPLRLDALHDVLEEIRASYARVRNTEYMSGRGNLVAVSESMQGVMHLVEQVARSAATVLVTGESGTGKELVVRRIHELSGRKGEFVAVNCGAIPEHLLESELFGHERGAFTGAVKARAGKFEMANGGTFFLDEIGDMPANMQVKLLRVLEERVVDRVGGATSIPVNVRMVAATHRDLPREIDAGRFREDLYYRLSVFPIELPPLRERRDDILPLVAEFVRRLSSEQSATLRVTDGALRCLEDYAWPGNIRELSNVMERLAVTCPSGLVAETDLPWTISNSGNAGNAGSAEHAGGVEEQAGPRMAGMSLPSEGIVLKEYLDQVERELIEKALTDTNGVVQKAADKLGLGRTTLVEKMRRYNVRKG